MQEQFYAYFYFLTSKTIIKKILIYFKKFCQSRSSLISSIASFYDLSKNIHGVRLYCFSLFTLFYLNRNFS
jgi:hypothetical protein